MVRFNPIFNVGSIILTFLVPIILCTYIYRHRDDAQRAKPCHIELAKWACIGAIIFLLIFANNHTTAVLSTVQGSSTAVYCTIAALAAGCLLIIAIMSLLLWWWLPDNTMERTICKNVPVVSSIVLMIQVILAVIGLFAGVYSVNAMST